MLRRPFAAEFLGTFLFVLIGAGSAVAGGDPGAPLLTAALANGLALAMAVTLCMPVSGGQLNPAVSIGLVVARKQTPARAAVLIVAQLLGAACAAGMLQFIFTAEYANSERAALGATTGSFNAAGHALGILGIEALCTFFLMLSVLASVVDPRAHKLGGLPVGLTVAAMVLFAGPFTGGSFNPARTFGPAICGRHWELHWTYWFGPVLGAAAAALAYRAFWEPAGAPSTRHSRPADPTAVAILEVTAERHRSPPPHPPRPAACPRCS